MSGAFQKTPGWLDWYPTPTKPRFVVPSGSSLFMHCHVFGPGAEFLAPERKYTPCDASKNQLFALRDHLGFSRNVVVQATCHGADNRAMIDCLLHSNGRARGVATVKRSVTDRELEAMHKAGVRGVRFNFVKRLVDFTYRTNSSRSLPASPASAGTSSSISRRRTFLDNQKYEDLARTAQRAEARTTLLKSRNSQTVPSVKRQTTEA